MKDYSRKHYTDYQYRDWVRSTPSKAIWNSILINNAGFAEFSPKKGSKGTLSSSVALYLKQSELKKPYLNRGFVQMEDDWEGPPGFPGDPEDVHYPEYPWTVGPPGSVTTPWTVVFDIIAPYACYCEGETRMFEVRGTHPIDRLDWNGGGVFSVIGGYGTNSVLCQLEVAEEENGSGNITGYMTTHNGITGNSNKLVRECLDCQECPVADPLVLGSNPETMDHDSSVTINVADGLGPYDWVVATTGQGYSVSNATTTTTSNTLIAAFAACGSAMVTVTDKCGDVVVIEVRGVKGEWAWKSNDCELPGDQTEDGLIIIYGRYKQTQGWSAGCICNPPGDQYNCTNCSSSGDGNCASSCGESGTGTVCIQMVDDCTPVYPGPPVLNLVGLCCEHPTNDFCFALTVHAPDLYQWDCPTFP